MGRTHRAKRDGGRSETDQAAVAGVGLMHNVGVVIAQLVEDGVDPVKVLGYHELTDDPLQPAAEVRSGVRGRARGRWTKGTTYSRAPTFRFSYILSFSARWMLASMVSAGRRDGRRRR